MAEDVDKESKTEEPTPRRREEARRKGSTPFSAEAVGALVLLSGVIGLSNFGQDISGTMLDIFKQNLRQLAKPDFGTTQAQFIILRVLLDMLTVLLPFLGILLFVGIAGSLVQVGFQISEEKLAPDFDKLNPAQGAGKLFSTASLVKGGLAILKIIAIAGVAYFLLEPRLGTIITLGRNPLITTVGNAWSIIMRLALYLSAAIAVVAILDYIYQRQKFEASLRMTKQELKEELKQEEGDPMIKQRMRQLGRERAKRKMLAEVPKSTVVITNPTHYAAALRYDTSQDVSPVLVAKGRGQLAKMIIDRARSHNVPVLERPELTRVIYKYVKEGQPIPSHLFRAVAEVIRFIYKLKGILT